MPGVTSVSYNLHPSKHLSSRKETDDLSKDYASSSQLCGVNVSHSLEHCPGATGWNESIRIADALDETLEVGLEG